MVYDIETGFLKYLDIDFKKVLKKYKSIYTVSNFNNKKPPGQDSSPAPVSLMPESSGREGDVLVVVTSVGGEVRPFKCNVADTVGSVKAALEAATAVKADQMELLHGGKVLADGATLESCGIDTFVEITQRITLTPEAFKRKAS